MLLQSQWQVKLTRAGVTLLAFSDRMETEPVIDPAGQLQEVTYLRAAYAGQFGRGNVRTTITFSQVRTFSTWALAMAFMAPYVAALPICQAPDTLEVTLAGGGVMSLSNAVLVSAGKPTIKNGTRFTASYTVVGSQLGYAAQALDNTDGSPLENTDGSPLQNTNQT